MARLIIDVYRGIVNGVYTDMPEDMEVIVCDSDDEHDEEHASQFAALQRQMERGGMRDAMNLSAPKERNIPVFDSNAFLLIREPNIAQTESGRAVQRLSAAFVDGYLSAHGELSRYLMQMYRDKHHNAAEVYHSLSPLLDRQNHTFDALCEDLNHPEQFDEAIEGAAPSEK